jgi:hypothetical protein
VKERVSQRGERNVAINIQKLPKAMKISVSELLPGDFESELSRSDIVTQTVTNWPPSHRVG